MYIKDDYENRLACGFFDLVGYEIEIFQFGKWKGGQCLTMEGNLVI